MHVAARRRPQGGFSFIEILVVMGIITLLASMVVVIIPIINERAARTKSQDNVKNLVMMMQAISPNISQWPGYSGKNLVLAPIVHGVHNPDAPGAMEVFFSPNDSNYKVTNVEVQNYRDLTKQKLKSESHKNLTSYAGRRNGDGAQFVLAASDTSAKGLICMCDDDDGIVHHEAGLVVGYANGRAEFMTWDDLGMSKPRTSDRAPDPFLGENATSELLSMLSSE